jgi:hypothetical protein
MFMTKFILDCTIRVASKNAWEIEIYFKVRSHKMPWSCEAAQSPSELRNKSIIHWFKISWDLVLTQVFMSRKHTLVPKRIICQKPSSSMELIPTLNVWRWKQQNQELDNSMWILLFVQIQGQNGMSVSCNNIKDNEWQTFNIRWSVKWNRGTHFLHSEELHFTSSYQHISRKWQSKTSAFQYAIQLS